MSYYDTHRLLTNAKFELEIINRGYKSDTYSSKEDCLRHIEQLEQQLGGNIEEPPPVKCSSFEEVKAMFEKYGLDRHYIVDATNLDKAEIEKIEKFILDNVK